MQCCLAPTTSAAWQGLEVSQKNRMLTLTDAAQHVCSSETSQKTLVVWLLSETHLLLVVMIAEEFETRDGCQQRLP